MANASHKVTSTEETEQRAQDEGNEQRGNPDSQVAEGHSSCTQARNLEGLSPCALSRVTEGQSVLSVVLDIQRRTGEQASQPSRASFDILTRVCGNSGPSSQHQDFVSDRATVATSPLVSSLEVNLSDTVLARSITLENDDSRAEARIQLVDSGQFSQSPPSYTTIPPEESYFHAPPPPPSYEQTFGIRYLDRDLPFIAINNSAGNIWGYRSQPAYCARCTAMVLTNIETEFCYITHLTAAISFISLCWPCMLIPYVLPYFKEVHHYCPACNQFLGCYRPISRRHNSTPIRTNVR